MAEESIVDVSTKSPPVESADAEEMQAELERLRAENERLEKVASPHTFWRNGGAGVLIVIGVLLFSLAISAIWLNRTIMDENRWVETVAPLAQDPAIQSYVANTASNAIFNAVDIQSYVEQALKPLPPQAQILAAPITGAVQSFVRSAATKFTQSPQFPQVWIQMNRLAHKAFIASVTQTQGGLVSNQNGKVTLDVSVLIDQIKQAMTAQGLGFVNNIPIPATQTQITLLDSPALGQLSLAIQLMNASAFILPLLAIALLAGGVALAVNRRKAVLWMGIGIIALTLIPVQAIYLGQYPFAKAALSLGQMPTNAAQDAYNIVFRNLVEANQIAAFIGLVFVLGAIVVGPSKWATALRSGFQHGIDNIGPDWDFGPVGQWIFDHRTGVRSAGVIAAIVLLLLVPAKTIATVLWLVVAVLVWLLAVAVFGRPRPVHADTAAAGGSGSDSEAAAGADSSSAGDSTDSDVAAMS